VHRLTPLPALAFVVGLALLAWAGLEGGRLLGVAGGLPVGLAALASARPGRRL
jgi:hypothetical protein